MSFVKATSSFYNPRNLVQNKSNLKFIYEYEHIGLCYARKEFFYISILCKNPKVTTNTSI